MWRRRRTSHLERSFLRRLCSLRREPRTNGRQTLHCDQTLPWGTCAGTLQGGKCCSRIVNFSLYSYVKNAHSLLVWLLVVMRSWKWVSLRKPTVKNEHVHTEHVRTGLQILTDCDAVRYCMLAGEDCMPRHWLLVGTVHCPADVNVTWWSVWCTSRLEALSCWCSNSDFSICLCSLQLHLHNAVMKLSLANVTVSCSNKRHS